MDNVATMAVKDRMELFAETADRKRLQVSLIEKDFWVCWSLGRLFSLSKQPASMIFKGGTSLSKVFNVIHRFSEDVDLSLNREDLGFVDEKNPQQAPSGKKAQKLIADLSETCKRVIREELVPSIEESCASTGPSLKSCLHQDITRAISRFAFLDNPQTSLILGLEVPVLANVCNIRATAIS